jgi:hypothetical protein
MFNSGECYTPIVNNTPQEISQEQFWQEQIKLK